MEENRLFVLEEKDKKYKIKKIDNVTVKKESRKKEKEGVKEREVGWRERVIFPEVYGPVTLNHIYLV